MKRISHLTLEFLILIELFSIMIFIIVISALFPETQTAASDIECGLAEYGGFMKRVCTHIRNGGKFLQCFNHHLYYDPQSLFVPCPGDTHFYQLCGLSEANLARVGDVHDRQFSAGLCGDFLCKTLGGTITLGADRMKCNGLFDCLNKALDEEDCDYADNKDYGFLSSGHKLESDLFCNDVCDALECEDEAHCNGFLYGMYCKIVPTVGKDDMGIMTYINPRNMCDAGGSGECIDFRDQKNCKIDQADNPNDLCSVPQFSYPREIRLKPSMRCSVPIGYPICNNYLEQTNCSDVERVAFSCTVRGYQTTISRFIVCMKGGGSDHLCEDNLENWCESLTPGCYTHKHRICDHNPDCPDQSDETNEVCSQVTVKTCIRRGRPGINLPIPVSWLMDDFIDCLNGEDEHSKLWVTCGSGIARRFVPENEDNLCSDVFLCQDGYVESTFLCDGVESCGSENHVCSVSRSFPNIYTNLQVSQLKGDVRFYAMFFCTKGLSSIVRLDNDMCAEQSFRYPEHTVLGLNDRKLIVPLGARSCDHLFGENYVFMSCNSYNVCEKSRCPLNADFPTHDSCSSKLQQRIKTFASGKKPYLTFLIRKDHGLYRNENFVCDQKTKCIPFSKVCDLILDCHDGTDESNCTNHFMCSSNDQLIPKTQKCDGEYNCLDLSDECNEQCSRELLNSIGLKIAGWFSGFSATLTNTVALIENMHSAIQTKNYRTLENKIYLTLINLGDLMIGIYLLILAFADSFFGHGYCFEQTLWLSDRQCSLLGILNTVGSLLSVFSMTILSLIRVKTIRNSLRETSALTNKKVILLILQVVVVISISTFLAIFPLSSHVEDFFVNGQFYDPRERIFIGFPNKAEHLNVITRYYGRMQKKELKWKLINELVDGMFSKDYGGLKKRKLDFYGNDGTCMFKYFVKTTDPQKEFVWCILLCNLVCFLIITASYMTIAGISMNTSTTLGERFKKRQQSTQRKVTAIILTDCLCWIPFIIVCILHSLEVFDATEWYSVFSVLILPLNSVINPLLYGDVIKKIRGFVDRYSKVLHPKKGNKVANIEMADVLSQGEGQRTDGCDSICLSPIKPIEEH